MDAPDDMLVFSYDEDIIGLFSVMETLIGLGYIFVVSPPHRSIAISREAAIAIGAR